MSPLCPTEDSADIQMTTSPGQYRLAIEVERAQLGTDGCHFSHLNKEINPLDLLVEKTRRTIPPGRVRPGWLDGRI